MAITQTIEIPADRRITGQYNITDAFFEPLDDFKDYM